MTSVIVSVIRIRSGHGPGIGGAAEAISNPRFGEDVFGVGRIVFDLLAQGLDDDWIR
jgi:hypothetical protein